MPPALPGTRVLTNLARLMASKKEARRGEAGRAERGFTEVARAAGFQNSRLARAFRQHLPPENWTGDFWWYPILSIE
jgi:hypothetical protein